MFIADFHIHSKYSRATSRDCVPELLELWARNKGLGLIGTGDFTHPAWRQELRDKLVPTGEGLYTLREEHRRQAAVAGDGEAPRFVITGEISSIYKKNGRVRKVHNLILLPDLEAAETLSHRLERIGNLHSDGRPILGLDSRDLLEAALEACPQVIFIPAHIWTPHFSLFGAYSGFDDIEECFEDLTGHIHALETGLSSDPPMNWRLSALDRFAMVSNSDAHSPGKLAREANLFDTRLTYGHIARALDGRDPGGFQGTLEFFPEEGKYHFNGHRKCSVCQSPAQTAASGGLCPVCGGRVTVGVLQRVEELADRPEGYTPPGARRYESLIPLPEVLAASTGHSPKSKRGTALYARLLRDLGPELRILRESPVGEIEQVAGPAVAEGIRRLRAGEVDVRPGYDGEYGKVRILDTAEQNRLAGQMQFFPLEAAVPKAPRRRKEAAPKAIPGPAPGKPRACEQTDALQGLNEEQRVAAFSNAPVTAVIAGPGTGKTKTLVARIAHLVGSQGVSPSAITAVTFTNKAAAELRYRLQRHFGEGETVRSMTVGTFHAICLDRLRQAGEEPSVVDDATAAALLEELLGEQKEKLSVREAQRRISLRKCGCGAACEEDSCPEELYRAYNQRLKDCGALDYDDLLLRALELEPREALPVHLLVDEFQDVNPVQYRLIRRWSAAAEGVFLIGDPDQAIYGFRGSDSRCFAWLRADYSHVEEIALYRNYRSTPQILGAAVPLMAASEESRAAGLQAMGEPGPRVRLLHAGSAFSEAVFVAKEINRLIGGVDMRDTDRATHPAKPRGLSEIAVLYRTNRQAALLEDCLTQEGIPYVVTGREDLLSHAQARGLVAFLRLLLHPGDLLSLRLCLREEECAPARIQGILQQLRDGEPGLPSLLALLEAAGTPPLDRLAGELRHWGEAAAAPPRELIAHWAAQRGKAGEEWVDKLLRTAAFHPTLADFLRALTLGGEADLRRGGRQYSGDGISLMTLHGAKGLEFPVVLLCGVAEGLLPHRGRLGQDKEEERRLLYVGMTRAREELILLNPGAPSPFLADLPKALLAEERLQRPAGEGALQLSLF